MRTDVKLGIVIALPVLLAGAFYLQRDKDEKPVELKEQSLADAAKEAAAPSPAGNNKAANSNRRPNRTSTSTRNTPNNRASRNRNAGRSSSTKAPGAAQTNANPDRSTRPSKPTPHKGANRNTRQTNTPQSHAARNTSRPDRTNRTNRNQAQRNTTSGAGKQTANRNNARNRSVTPGSGASGSASQKAPNQKASGAQGTRTARKTTPGRTEPVNHRQSATRRPSSSTVPGNADERKSASRDNSAASRRSSGSPRDFNSRKADNNPKLPARAENRTAGRSASANKPGTADRQSPQRSAANDPSNARVSNARQKTIQVEQSQVADDTHRIREGDTFAELAVEYYGHERFTQYLIDANKQVGDPTKLRVGASIRIPPLPAQLAARSTPSRTKTAGVAGGNTYVVKSGDTFYGIAKSTLGNASRWRELFELNKQTVGDDPSKLKVGQVLILPR